MSPSLLPLLAIDPNSHESAPGRLRVDEFPSFGNSEPSSHKRQSRFRSAPPPAHNSSPSAELPISRDPIKVLRRLFESPEQWRHWGYRVKHISGLELELRHGLAQFTDDSSMSFPMSVVESFFFGRRIDDLLRRKTKGVLYSGMSKRGTVKLLCKSMRTQPEMWEVCRGIVRHRTGGVEIWFSEGEFMIAGFTDASSCRFRLNFLSRWRLWRAARFLVRRQIALDLSSSSALTQQH